ncbi:MAG: acetyl-CoA carboxylase carboxyl transferase subunit alpha, partial [Rubricoccaceae bacterium]|nr:acetyl-CoA carboxylase carboxyl transferase subunit alpha [Rubricoccaceae bacterium]
TAMDLIEHGVIDEIIPEKIGGAHRDPNGTFESVGQAVAKHLDELLELPTDSLLSSRIAKFDAMGAVVEGDPA